MLLLYFMSSGRYTSLWTEPFLGVGGVIGHIVALSLQLYREATDIYNNKTQKDSKKRKY